MSKKSTQAYHHGDLRQALIASACAMIARDGPEAVTLRGAAKAAGVSSAAPYHHFRDKTALLAAVAANAYRDFTQTMRAYADGAAEPGDRLTKLGVGYVRYAVQNPALFRFIQGPSLQCIDDDDLNRARQESAAPLIEAVSACLPGADEEKVKLGCAAAWSLVHGLASLCNHGRLQKLVDVSDIDALTALITNQLALERCLDPR